MPSKYARVVVRVCASSGGAVFALSKAPYLVSREERCHGDLSGLSRLAAAVNATKIEDNKRASHWSRRLKL